MLHPPVSEEEMDRLGDEIYEQKLRPLVETDENIGKIISIDVISGDYAIADDPLASSDEMYARHPDAALFSLRIGYNAVYQIGGGSVVSLMPPMSPPRLSDAL